MKRRTLLMSGAGTALAATLGMPLRAQDVTKVGFIYVGPVGDGGWTYQHDLGRQEMAAALGGAVETVFQESVPEGADAERAITQMVLSGCKLIFTTSFGYMDPTINVAAQFPDVKFEHATGYKTADNVSVYDSRFYEGRAVIGTIAGRMTKTNKIGYIASFPIPEVIQGINSSFIHARKVNPNVEMVIIWAFTWFDPAKEADAAKAMIEQGCDVILQHTDSTAPQAAAQEAGNVITFGQASDMAAFAPSPRVASIIDNWGPYYTARTQAVLDGRHGRRPCGHRPDFRRRAPRGEGRGRGDDRRHHGGHLSPVHRPPEQTGRHPVPGRWRCGHGRGTGRHGVLSGRDHGRHSVLILPFRVFKRPAIGGPFRLQAPRLCRINGPSSAQDLTMTDLLAQRAAFGCMQWGGQADAAEAAQMFDACLAAGITHFDTAWGYHAGRSEEILGQLARGRDGLTIATKVAWDGGTRARILDQFDQCRSRLAIDRVDVLYVHYWRSDVPLEETIATLAELQDRGLVGALALSNHPAWVVMKAQGIAARHGTRIAAIQPMFSIVKRQAMVELLPMAADQGIAAFCYSPLGGGLLTGKYAAGGAGRLDWDANYKVRYGEAAMRDAAAGLAALAAEAGMHPATLAVAWVLGHPKGAKPILSGASAAQLAPSLAALTWRLDPDLQARISALYPDPAPATDRTEEK
jgi:basic membrane protein A and related proteins